MESRFNFLRPTCSMVVYRSFSTSIHQPTPDDHSVEFLQGFEVYLMCDGYSGYNKIANAKRSRLLGSYQEIPDRCHS